MLTRRMLSTIARELLRLAAVGVLGALYGAAALLCRVARHRPRPQGPRSGCILVIGTFHNPNWFHAHLRPLVRSGVGEVILVCDEVVPDAPGVRFECPSPWMALVFTRAGAKLLHALRCALRYRPDLYMGYHIFPAALTALALARLFGRPACYQDTSGPIELEGGGWNVENRLLRALGRPSRLVERLVNAVVRQFDSVVVRGSGAEAYVRKIGYRGALAIITGSVASPGRWRDYGERSIDMAFVGRLAEIKCPERFIRVAAELARTRPTLRAVVVGEGPEAQPMQRLARELGIAQNVEFLGKRSDVYALLETTRLFFLTSRSEGVSIAMLEAMACGAVPVVANVGDLADVVRNEQSGFLVQPGDIPGYVRAAQQLLGDEALWRRFSSQAVSACMAASSIPAIAARWEQHLHGVMLAHRAQRPVMSPAS